MKDAQKPDHVSLNVLIHRLKEGRFVIPDFQREFEWRPWDIRDLMRSIFLDYYIGSLLLWKGKEESFTALSCEPIYGHHATASQSEHIVLDGQQRLTAMYYTFLAPDVPLPNRANRAIYYIRVDRLMDEVFDDAFQYDWISKRLTKLLANCTAQYEEHFFPLSVIGAGGWELANWVQGYEQHWQQVEQTCTNAGDEDGAEIARFNVVRAKDFGELLKGITEQYQISYIELDQDLAIDKVCDIFTQINSRGIRLDVFDLMNALLKPKGLQLKQLWRSASRRLEFVDTEKMNVYILQIMSILRQAYCSPKYLYYLLPGEEKTVRGGDGTKHKEVLVQTAAEFRDLWNTAVSALENAIRMLKHPQEFGVPTSQYLPYVSILPVFAALQHEITKLPDHLKLHAQRKIRHWYWASVFLNRYSGAVESTTARDYLDVKAWFTDDELEPSVIDEFKKRFRSLDLKREVKRGTSVYNGIFNLLVLNGARDWNTGKIPQFDNLDDHHIVPVAWGNKNLAGNVIHTILNRTPLTSESNRKVIRDRLPNEYLPELKARANAEEFQELMETHFISERALEILLRTPFTPDNYEAFISERMRTIIASIESLIVKERISMPKDLRALDISIEKIELRLRELIVNRFGDDSSNLPEHVRKRAQERIQKVTRRNPSIDPEYYNSPEGMLEYCDLRELQDVILGTVNWTQFKEMFVSKENLTGKFGQLAELRNTLRHSRTLDPVTRKEGEAAVIWFDTILTE